MRTVIELDERRREKLYKIATARGDRGVSGVIREAIDRFLAEQGELAKRNAALRAEGTLSDEEAAALRAHVAELRASWR